MFSRIHFLPFNKFIISNHIIHVVIPNFQTIVFMTHVAGGCGHGDGKTIISSNSFGDIIIVS